MVSTSSLSSPPIQLQLEAMPPRDGLRCQKLVIHLNRSDRIVQPQDLTALSLPTDVDLTAGVILSGRAPIWLYAHLVHELHPTPWVACFDPRLNGAVVVATHSLQAKVGQVISLAEDEQRPRLGAALLVVGPPDSGKSVLSHSLFQALLPGHPNIFLQRAQWDGEGNWLLELPSSLTSEDREAFKLFYKGDLTTDFFPYQAQAILQLRRQKPLVIVDVGGRVQPEKVPILDACSHYLVISSKPEAIEEWHQFCRDRGNLKCLAVIHSSLDPCEILHKREPWLEVTCGPWVQGSPGPVPSALLERVQALLPRSS